MSAVVLRLLCAWCQTVLVAGTPGAPTSHGICPACLTESLKEVA